MSPPRLTTGVWNHRPRPGSICKQVHAKHPETGKHEYLPNLRTHTQSTPWGLFTDDYFRRSPKGGLLCFRSQCLCAFQEASRQIRSTMSQTSNPRMWSGLTSPCASPSFRSEEHTSELQSLMRISYAVFCLKKKKNKITHINTRIM